eukprot:3038343-Alexandrium_andersonii.AAC.1
MAPKRAFRGCPERERRKLLEAAQNRWNPSEPAGTAEDPLLKVKALRCRRSRQHGIAECRTAE